MCIATRCTSVEQFIQTFHRFVDEESFFVSTLNTRPPGLETSFSVQLADGTPVLRGLCVVLQAWTDNQNPFKTPGVRLGIKRLTANSMVVFEQLLITRSGTKPPTVTSVGMSAPAPATKASPFSSIPTPPPIPIPGQPSGPAPKVIIPMQAVQTKPLGIGVPAKLPAVVPAAASLPPMPGTPAATVPSITVPPKPIDRGLADTAKLEPAVVARAASEPIPEVIPSEPTDVTEEKTDIREPKKPLAAPVLPLAAPEERPSAVTMVSPNAPPERPSIPAIDAPIRPSAAALDTGETRTPGSELVLPANPLQNLTDESLKGYVDCTLYEETGNFFPVDEDLSQFIDDVVPPPVLAPKPAIARTPTPLPLEARQRTVTPLPAAPVYEPPEGATARESSPTIDPTPLPPPARDSNVSLPSPLASTEPEPAPAEARPTANAFVERAGNSPAATNNVVATRRKRPSMWLLGGAVGVLLAATAVVVITTKSSDGGNPAPAPTPAPTKLAQANPPVERTQPPAVDPQDDPPDTDEPRSGDGPPVVGSGPCKVVVVTTPAGSIVQLDDNNVGPSPITVAASCDKHKLDVSHARYAPASKLVTLQAGKTEQVELTLARPTHIVTVTSNPSGAMIFIDGRSAGTTPTKLSVLGFVTLKLEFKKTGFQTASAKLYSKVPQDTVAVKLNRW
jgi:hypothetical protein